MTFNTNTLLFHFTRDFRAIQKIISDFCEETKDGILKLREKEVESQTEIIRLRQEIDERKNHETLLEHQINEKSNKIEELERESELVRKNCELDRKYSELLVMYSECQRKNGRLQNEIDEKSNKIEELIRKNNALKERNLELARKNCELDSNNSDLLVMYSECQRKNGRLEFEIGQKPSCPVCLENFDTESRQPYALSCPHMVCAQCLYPALERAANWIAYRSRDNRDSQGESHPSRRCPVCRTRVNTFLKKICL